MPTTISSNWSQAAYDELGPHNLPEISASRVESIAQTRQAVNALFQSAVNNNGVSSIQNAFDALVGSLKPLAAFNALMVQMQRPGHSLVATQTQWEKLGRTILPDARPILILHPHGPFNVIFELADTNGPEVTDKAFQALTASGATRRTDWDRLHLRARILGIIVSFEDTYGSRLAGTAAAICDLPERNNTDDSPRWRIRLNAQHDRPTSFATLGHELGHVLCGHLGSHPGGYWRDRPKLTHEIREMEAEAVAYLVCNRSGVATRSAEYLHSLIHRADCRQVDYHAIYNALQLLEGTSLDTAIANVRKRHRASQGPDGGDSASANGQLPLFRGDTS